MISVNLYSIIPSIFVGIISLVVLSYPEKKRLKHKEKRFEKKWKNEFMKQNSKKTKLEADVAFFNKQSQKQEVHISHIIFTDNRLNALAIALTLVALFL
jgi:Na+/H+ antiporter NhaC